jgi:hypothetical protein
MISKQRCLPNTNLIINDKITKWNQEMGTAHNGLVCFPYSAKGCLMGDEMELLPGTVITIIGGPRKYNENGNQVKFIINGDTSKPTKIMSAWWVSFKHKVDIVCLESQ